MAYNWATSAISPLVTRTRPSLPAAPSATGFVGTTPLAWVCPFCWLVSLPAFLSESTVNEPHSSLEKPPAAPLVLQEVIGDGREQQRTDRKNQGIRKTHVGLSCSWCQAAELRDIFLLTQQTWGYWVCSNTKRITWFCRNSLDHSYRVVVAKQNLQIIIAVGSLPIENEYYKPAYHDQAAGGVYIVHVCALIIYYKIHSTL